MKKYIKHYTIVFEDNQQNDIKVKGQANKVLSILKRMLKDKVDDSTLRKNILKKTQECMSDITQKHSNTYSLSKERVNYSYSTESSKETDAYFFVEVSCVVEKLAPPNKHRENDMGENIHDKRKAALRNKYELAREFDEYLKKFKGLLDCLMSYNSQFLEYFKQTLEKDSLVCYSKTLFEPLNLYILFPLNLLYVLISFI